MTRGQLSLLRVDFGALAQEAEGASGRLNNGGSETQLSMSRII
jgi:hypothetical protein